MDNEAHVGLVDAHSEGYGGHDDVDLFHEEIVLSLRARVAVEAGMIGSGLDVVGLEHRRQFLHLLARQAVDDAALARVLADEAYDLLVNVLGLLPHLVVEVGTVERALELTRVLDAEAALYVGAHLVGGGGGEGYYRCHAYLFYRTAYLSVFRTEVVAPLRDAVGLVDGIERHLDLLEELDVFLLVERFGSHIQQLGMPGFHVGFHVVYGGFLER